ncbi:hypothetical protein DFH09DRAFT_1071636 [Mycena vulgaris]|nr:hypothetical protein DFH09DRAFT_1071636 [Mycena vulgaris]
MALTVEFQAYMCSNWLLEPHCGGLSTVQATLRSLGPGKSSVDASVNVNATLTHGGYALTQSSARIDSDGTQTCGVLKDEFARSAEVRRESLIGNSAQRVHSGYFIDTTAAHGTRLLKFLEQSLNWANSQITPQPLAKFDSEQTRLNVTRTARATGVKKRAATEKMHNSWRLQLWYDHERRRAAQARRGETLERRRN